MSCQNKCNIEQGFFRGDDLVDVITVNVINDEGKTFTKAELQVGKFTFVEKNPVFPYPVSILRDKSKDMDLLNPVHLRLYYLSANGQEEYRTTCIGYLTLKVNPQVVNDVIEDVAEEVLEKEQNE